MSEWRTQRGRGLSRLSAGCEAEGPTTTAAAAVGHHHRDLPHSPHTQMAGTTALVGTWIVDKRRCFIYFGPERGLNNDSTNECVRTTNQGPRKNLNSFGVIG